MKFGWLILMVCCGAWAQEAAQEPAVEQVDQGSGRQYRTDDRKRILGIIPNFATTSVNAKDVMSLTARQKLRLAARDSFDPGAYFTTALLTGFSHAGRQYYPDIPLGAKGFAWRYGLNFTDNVAAGFVSEGLLPALTKQDPRYFRLGEGSIAKRTGYLISRVAVARKDSGGWTFNAGGVVGNFAVAGLANLYYPNEHRSAQNTLIRFGINAGSSILVNAAREFWPDVARKLRRKP